MTAESKREYSSTTSAAEVSAALYYEQKFVPSLFQPWCATLIDACKVKPDDQVLDIACGTGVVTRELEQLGCTESKLAGLDLSPGMIEIARSLQPRVEWRVGNACELPYSGNSFDRALCQFGLMFFPDRVLALREMKRVLRPGGRIVALVWNELEHNPGFSEMVSVLQRLAGTRAADALRAPFCLGDEKLLQSLVDQAEIGNTTIETHHGEARFLHLREFVEAELRGWLPIMDVHLEDTQIESIYHECVESLAGYLKPATSNLVMPVSAKAIIIA